MLTSTSEMLTLGNFRKRRIIGSTLSFEPTARGLDRALKEHLSGTGLSQAQIAKLFGVTQPRVSDLMRGKIDVFGLDALVNMAAAAGLRVKLSVRKAA
jgi:predicted XRE-type DNA-binding protein